MKWQAIFVLLTIALSIVVPPSLPLMVLHDGRAELGALDVCHAATPALSSNGDMPVINACSSEPLPLACITVVEIVNPYFKPFFFSFPDERPPEA